LLGARRPIAGRPNASLQGRGTARFTISGGLDMRSIILTSALLFALSAGSALAHQCPTMMAEIDAALPNAQLSGQDRERVMELRKEGEELHEAGDHDASEAALAEAMTILGIHGGESDTQ